MTDGPQHPGASEQADPPTEPQPPAASAWSYQSDTAGLSSPPSYPGPQPATDVLISPAGAAVGGGRRRGLPIVVAVATAVAVLLGVGAYAGMRMWYGSGAQPEEATPSSVVAFARLDLSPGYGQGLKIRNLLRKFPQESGRDPVDELKREIFEALDVDESMYRKHVGPWFAERVGVALWLDGRKQPYRLVMLATDDQSAARDGLNELQRNEGTDELGFVLSGGYALVATGSRGSQAAAEAAAKDAERESLAQSARFREGADWLPDQQTALGWADLERLDEAVEAATKGLIEGLPAEPGAGPDSPALAPGLGVLGFGMGGLGMGGPSTLSDLKGHLIVGARATDTGVDIRFRGFGVGGATADDVRSAVDSLPGNSAVAASLRAGDLSEQAAGLFVPPDIEDLPPEAFPPGELPPDLDDIRKEMAAIGKAVSALSGAKVTVAATGLDGEDGPAMLASAETTSAGNAAKVAETLKLLADDATVTTSGNKIELRTKGYEPAGGVLADQDLYREALDGAPEPASAVVFVDLQRVLADGQRSEKERRRTAPLKAVGLATGVEDGDPIGLVRVVIK